MAQAVVYDLEVVQVDDAHAQMSGGPCGELPLAGIPVAANPSLEPQGDLGLPGAAVRQPSDRVGVGLNREAVPLAGAVGQLPPQPCYLPAERAGEPKFAIGGIFGQLDICVTPPPYADHECPPQMAPAPFGGGGRPRGTVENHNVDIACGLSRLEDYHRVLTSHGTGQTGCSRGIAANDQDVHGLRVAHGKPL